MEDLFHKSGKTRKETAQSGLFGRLRWAFALFAASFPALMPAQTVGAAETAGQGVTINVYNWGNTLPTAPTVPWT